MCIRLVASDPPLTKLPFRFTHELFDAMVAEEPTVFTSSPWYDGRAIMYSTVLLPLGPNDSREVSISISSAILADNFIFAVQCSDKRSYQP